MQTEHELPMLAGIAAILEWFEHLLNLINGPLLMFGAGIALVDLLTDGKLTATSVYLLYAWAISQALGIDTQLLGCFARARNARGWEMAGWLMLGGILGYAAWQAGYVFAVQQARGVSEAEALTRLGMSSDVWLGWRVFLAVGLVALAGWTRYRRPAANYASEREKLQARLELEPLRAQLRARQALGWRGTLDAALGHDRKDPTRTQATPLAAPVVDVQPEPFPPEPDPTPPPERRGAGEPDTGKSDAEDMLATPYVSSIRALPSRIPDKRRVAGKLSREDVRYIQAAALLDANPAMSKLDLRKALRCRQETANSLYARWQIAQRRQMVQ